TTNPREPFPHAPGLVAHALELATRPPDDIGIDPDQGRTQLRRIEVAVVADPAADAWIVECSQLIQGVVTAPMERPATDFATDARQRLRAGGGLEAVREDTLLAFPPHRLPGTELEP